MATASRPARKETIRIGGAALLAALVSLFLFSPRFFFWREMEIPLLPAMPPEVARAKFAVMQLKHPFMRMDNHISLVLQWRLFFPLLGYALSLPPLVYLALPPLGCWLVLVYIMAVLRRHEIGWPDCLAVAILTATCSWFFVSTGWLAYFDSWWVLGLLVFVFSRPRLAAIAV